MREKQNILKIEGTINVTINRYKIGVYSLGRGAATGKSYLFKILNYNKKLGKNYKAISYGDDLKDLSKYHGYDIILFDRLDLYYSHQLGEVINYLGTGSLVLVDLKDLNLYKWYMGLSDINLDDNGVNITLF